MLERIIWLRKMIRKYLIFVLLFGTRIRSKQASLFILHRKQIPFSKSNYGHFGPFLVITEPFLHVFALVLDINKYKPNNDLFWIDFSDLRVPNNLIVLIVNIQHYSTFKSDQCGIINFNLFYHLNHLILSIFDSF